jgi:hypothetical protein
MDNSGEIHLPEIGFSGSKSWANSAESEKSDDAMIDQDFLHFMYNERSSYRCANSARDLPTGTVSARPAFTSRRTSPLSIDFDRSTRPLLTHFHTSRCVSPTTPSSTRARPIPEVDTSDNLIHLLTPQVTTNRKAAHESRNPPEPIQILDFLPRHHHVHACHIFISKNPCIARPNEVGHIDTMDRTHPTSHK